MKNFIKRTFLFAVVLSIAAVSFSSCSDDDDDKSGGLASKVVGEYVGELTSIPQSGTVTAKVEAVSSDRVKITFVGTAIAPVEVTLKDTGVDGILQSVTAMYSCQFYTESNSLIFSHLNSKYTFSGERNSSGL